MDSDSSKFQGLKWKLDGEEIYLRDNRLCMGMSSSPYVFSKMSNFIVRAAQRRGCDRVVNYLDDFCIINATKEGCTRDQLELVAVLRHMGFDISFKKLSSPSQITRFLGIIVDSQKMNLSLPQDKMDKMMENLRIVDRKNKVTKKVLEQLTGYLAHASKVVRGGRVFCRRLYDTLKSLKKPHHKVRVAGEMKKDILWWIEFAQEFNGAARILGSSAPMVSTYSDSSTSWGYGVIHGEDWLAAKWKGVKKEAAVVIPEHHRGEVPDIPMKDDIINVLELWPILVALDKWGHQWKDLSVCMVSDNTQVVAALRSGKSKNVTSMAWLRKIFWHAVRKNLDIKSVYIRSEDNTISDALSRLCDRSSVERIRQADKLGVMCCSKIFCHLQDGGS